MKILGSTPEGDLIIQVSQAEWDGLQDGVRPLDDFDSAMQRLQLWEDTEVGQLFAKNKGTRGLTAVRALYLNSKIDGTLENLRHWLSGHYLQIGLPSQAKLKKLLDDIKET